MEMIILLTQNRLQYVHEGRTRSGTDLFQEHFVGANWTEVHLYLALSRLLQPATKQEQNARHVHVNLYCHIVNDCRLCHIINIVSYC